MSVNKLILGDNLEIMRKMAENSIDSRPAEFAIRPSIWVFILFILYLQKK